MDYQNYEEYMRSVLGYGGIEPNYSYDTYYPRNEIELENNEAEKLYPEIYRIVNPEVENVCNKNRNKQVTDELVRSMTEEVYACVEAKSNLPLNVQVKTELKNGDVRNPNAKQETRQRNYLLNDLIKILIIRNLLNNRPPFRPPYPPPRPPFPGPGPRPPYMGGNHRTPIM